MRLMDSPESLATAFEPFKGDKTGPTGTCEKKANLEPRLDGDVEVGPARLLRHRGPQPRLHLDRRALRHDRLDRGRQGPTLQGALQALPVGRADRAARTSRPRPRPPSPRPRPSVGPEPTLQAGLSDAQASLALHVPAKIRGTCGPTTINVSALATAAVLCTATTPDGTIRVTYQQFPDQDALDTAYAGNLEFLGATRDSGPCSGDWPAETTWTVNDVVGGRVACAEIGGFSRDIAWTDDTLVILGLAETFDVPKDALRTVVAERVGPRQLRPMPARVVSPSAPA